MSIIVDTRPTDAAPKRRGVEQERTPTPLYTSYRGNSSSNRMEEDDGEDVNSAGFVSQISVDSDAEGSGESSGPADSGDSADSGLGVYERNAERAGKKKKLLRIDNIKPELLQEIHDLQRQLAELYVKAIGKKADQYSFADVDAHLKNKCDRYVSDFNEYNSLLKDSKTKLQNTRETIEKIPPEQKEKLNMYNDRKNTYKKEIQDTEKLVNPTRDMLNKQCPFYYRFSDNKSKYVPR